MESPAKRTSSRNVKRKLEFQDPYQPSNMAIFFVLEIAASICESLFYFCFKYLTNKYLSSLVLFLLERFLTWILKALDTKGMSSSAMTSNFLKILFLIMKVVAESETLQHPDFLH